MAVTTTFISDSCDWVLKNLQVRNSWTQNLMLIKGFVLHKAVTIKVPVWKWNCNKIENVLMYKIIQIIKKRHIPHSEATNAD